MQRVADLIGITISVLWREFPLLWGMAFGLTILMFFVALIKNRR